MGIQHEHKHLHGIKARQDMGENKYNFIHMAGKARDEGDSINNDNVVTIVHKVTVTEPKTFPGPAVYVTKTAEVETMNGAPMTTTMNSYESAKSLINTPKTRTGENYGDGYVKGTPMSHPEDIAAQNQGMSGGAKAGVAFGVILAIAAVAGLIFFCVRRRKNQVDNRGEKLDEKHASQNSFFSGTAAAVGAPAGDKRASVKSFGSSHTASTAPRLSLRPVTSFLPSILENRNNNNNLDVPAMSEKARSTSPQNPFSDRSASSNPFEEGDGKGPNTPNHSAKPSWESGSTGTPQVGTAAAVPISGAPRGQNNVHRVQLEFKPSMDDELELKSGQLVRMLHEYDDGWALCIRMDRTQQGVCPRTCLSKLPVKPRPQGPPQGRSSPPGVHGPPQGLNKMMPRPLTPTGRERASSAAGHHASPAAQEANRKRSMSVNSADRSVSPVDAGVPARKPLPGQAM